VAEITCSMCGHTFNPQGHTTCSACPVKKGCQLVCCPACGFETIDPQQSTLARLVMNFINRREAKEAHKIGENNL
jgi:rubredoxin